MHHEQGEGRAGRQAGRGLVASGRECKAKRRGGIETVFFWETDSACFFLKPEDSELLQPGKRATQLAGCSQMLGMGLEICILEALRVWKVANGGQDKTNLYGSAILRITLATRCGVHGAHPSPWPVLGEITRPILVATGALSARSGREGRDRGWREGEGEEQRLGFAFGDMGTPNKMNPSY